MLAHRSSHLRVRKARKRPLLADWMAKSKHSRPPHGPWLRELRSFGDELPMRLADAEDQANKG